MISLEEDDVGRWRRELWTLGSEEREGRGRCVGGLALVGAGADVGKEGKERIGQFVHRFVRRGAKNGGKPILGGMMQIGDPVMVSVDWDAMQEMSKPAPTIRAKGQRRFQYPRLLALARGYVLEMTSEAIVVGLDHRVDDAYVTKRVGVMEGTEMDVVYRVDKDELTGGVARIRDNLAQMFYVGASRRRLELIVDLEEPIFDSTPTRSLSVNNTAPIPLNPNQLQALSHILRAQDYALVLGMPGTGKTTTVAEVIRVLVRMGKSVLLSSYTHSAVDTILRKLVGGRKKEEVGVLRLGNVDKVSDVDW